LIRTIALNAAVLTVGAALCFPALAEAKVDDAITAASAEVGACFARDNPECAKPWIDKLKARVKGSKAVAYTEGYHALLAGDFDKAAQIFRGVQKATVVPESLRKRAKGFAALATETARLTAAMSDHKLLGGRVIVTVKPGADEVLLPWMEAVLKAAIPKLESAFGKLPSAPIRIHVYRKVEDLAKVSGLTAAQIRDSGTIALCKYNRLMMTSPNDLVFGYGWADTIVHELVHWIIIRKAGGAVPVWLHEGLARTFEATWRGVDPLAMDATEVGILRRARRRRKFIPFRKMSPSMARLPDQASTQLAFAEVHHAFAWMLARTRDKSATKKLDVTPLLAQFDKGDNESAALAAWLQTPRSKALKLWRKDLEAGLGPDRKMLAKRVARPSKLRFKRVRGADPFKGLGSQPRRWIELGDRLLAIDRPLGAVIEYRKALGSGAKRRPDLMRRLARALVALKRDEEARKVAVDTLAGHAEDAALLLLLARAEYGLGHHDKALAAAKRSAWINPYDPGLHALLAAVYTAKGDAKSAAVAKNALALLDK